MRPEAAKIHPCLSPLAPGGRGATGAAGACARRTGRVLPERTRPVQGGRTTMTRIFSGIQPTGAKTIGNYAGGFRQYAATQELGDAFFCIVDLHSITVEYDPAALRESTYDLLAMLVATGLDPER